MSSYLKRHRQGKREKSILYPTMHSIQNLDNTEQTFCHVNSAVCNQWKDIKSFSKPDVAYRISPSTFAMVQILQTKI